jgi:hypothetical protein
VLLTDSFGTDGVLLADTGGTDVLLADSGDTDGVLLDDTGGTDLCC